MRARRLSQVGAAGVKISVHRQLVLHRPCTSRKRGQRDSLLVVEQGDLPGTTCRIVLFREELWVDVSGDLQIPETVETPRGMEDRLSVQIKLKEPAAARCIGEASASIESESTSTTSVTDELIPGGTGDPDSPPAPGSWMRIFLSALAAAA